MFSEILDAIPVVGHVKGVLHLATGDTRAAKRSMYEASRSTAVIAGGAMGALGGPVGIAAGAAAAGAATDCFTSIVTQKPRGLISGVVDIVDEVSDGKVPLKSVLKTGFIVGVDMVGGFAGPAIGNCATKAIVESTGKGIAIEISKSGISTVTKSTLIHGASRSIIKDDQDEWSQFHDSRWYYSPPYRTYSRNSGGSNASENSQSSNYSNTGNSGSKSSGTNQQSDASKKSEDSKSSESGGNSGQQPNNNDNNKNNKKEHYENTTVSHWEKFLKIFKAKKLEDIVIEGKRIFEKINAWQKKELKDFITKINNNYKHFGLERIVNITMELLAQVEQDLVTSHNFVNVAKFVLAYLCEEQINYNEASRDCSKTFNARRVEQADIITSNHNSIIQMFKNLLREIARLSSTIDPRFVNVIAAVYHYFKHKFIESSNVLFAPAEYFNVAREGLARLRTLPQFARLMAAGVRRIIYQRYDAHIGRRLCIAIKQQGDKWNLASCYFEDDVHDGDEDGDEWINDEKLP